ncbi:DNA cytosine methyltransferase [Paenibacillus sp. NRS-1783]|uniref:DNA cytosine methyltransferase n=1 Tax=Paenibacillus sp. NRS-1783 TaxID=3233907 RepID=UPI003D2C331C
MYREEIYVDNFAGGGGASTGIEIAIGRSVDIAINHDPAAIAMHRANHPCTKHYCESVWDIDPVKAAEGKPVGLVWFSPDCKHFSKAKGCTPVEKGIRGLAWVTLRWASQVRPRVIMLENVEEFQQWGPLLARRDKKTGRVLKTDNTIAAAGEVVPLHLQQLTADPKRRGEIFRYFIKSLHSLGYQVEWRELKASDYGAPTSRKRLFLIARCDGYPIVWPAPTHGDPDSLEVREGIRKPWRTAANIIDWSIPTKSIFGRKRPLAVNTLRRIYRGIDKFILKKALRGETLFIAPMLAQNAEQYMQTENDRKLVTPFIARIGQTGFAGDRLQYPLENPLTTITTKNEHLLICPTLIQVGYGERKGQQPRVLHLDKPLGTVTAGGNKFALSTARLVKLEERADRSKACHVPAPSPGERGDSPETIAPAPSNTPEGFHPVEVRTFLLQYNGSSIGQDLDRPLNTITTKHRFGLVTIQGTDYRIVDIGFRMLEPHELFAAQGFPGSYIIDRYENGESATKADQVARCGNSVSPKMSTALVQANMSESCKGSGETLVFDRYEEAAEDKQLEFIL